MRLTRPPANGGGRGTEAIHLLDSASGTEGSLGVFFLGEHLPSAKRKSFGSGAALLLAIAYVGLAHEAGCGGAGGSGGGAGGSGGGAEGAGDSSGSPCAGDSDCDDGLGCNGQ